MIKCIAVDLDGTLLRDDKTISEYTRETLQTLIANEVHVIVASGRAFSALPEVVTGIKGIDYAVTSNGAAVYHMPTKSCVHSYLLQQDAVVRLLSLLQQEEISLEAFIKGIPYADAAYVRDPAAHGATEYAVDYIQRTRKPVDDMEDFIIKHIHELDSIDVVAGNDTLKRQIWDRIKEECPEFYMTSSAPQLLEISDQNAGKKSGLVYMQDTLAIKREEMMAFGDADNDQDMLAFAGRGVAMENASSGAIKAAGFRTESNNEDGVARECRRVFSHLFI